MITNVVLNSTDRELFGVSIRQNTKEQFLSVTDLQRAYEKGRLELGWTGQTIGQVMFSSDMAKKCYGVLLEANLMNFGIRKFMEMVESQGLIPVLKELGVYKTTGRGENKQVMAHPYIWVTIAIELNYVLYGKVIKWLTDTLIFDRVEAGDKFKPMNEAISRIITSPNYSNYSIMINKKVFGTHMTGMRNMASAKDLRRITDIEKFIIQSIDMGFIKNETDLMNAINIYK